MRISPLAGLMNKFVLTFAILLLSACGFKLKGAYSFDHLPVQHWQISGDALQQPLETAMRRATGQALPISGSPEAEIRVLSVDTKNDVYTITRGARINEYLLSMRVMAQAYYQGKPWGEPIAVHIRRSLPYSDGFILGKAEEEATIWQEMRQDAADQIVRRLAFLPNVPSSTVLP